MKSHTKPGHGMMITTIIHYGNSYYLFKSGGQVLDKKPPEVVERLQLPGLCECKEGNPAQRKQRISSRCWDIEILRFPPSTHYIRSGYNFIHKAHSSTDELRASIQAHNLAIWWDDIKFPISHYFIESNHLVAQPQRLGPELNVTSTVHSN